MSWSYSPKITYCGNAQKDLLRRCIVHSIRVTSSVNNRRLRRYKLTKSELIYLADRKLGNLPDGVYTSDYL